MLIQGIKSSSLNGVERAVFAHISVDEPRKGHLEKKLC